MYFKNNFIENYKTSSSSKKIIIIYERKIYVIKGFYRIFLTLKGKFHHQSQIILNFGRRI